MQNINRRKDSQSFTTNSAGKSMSDIHSRSNIDLERARPEYGNRAEMLWKFWLVSDIIQESGKEAGPFMFYRNLL